MFREFSGWNCSCNVCNFLSNLSIVVLINLTLVKMKSMKLLKGDSNYGNESFVNHYILLITGCMPLKISFMNWSLRNQIEILKTPTYMFSHGTRHREINVLKIGLSRLNPLINLLINRCENSKILSKNFSHGAT